MSFLQKKSPIECCSIAQCSSLTSLTKSAFRVRGFVVVVVEDFGSWVSPPSLNCLLASCPSTLILVSALGGVIPAKNPIHGCQGRPERTYSMVTKGAVAIGS